MNANKRDLVENQIAEAEAAKRRAYLDEIEPILKEIENTYKAELDLTEDQQEWVNKQVEQVKQQTKILKESCQKGKDEYEDFTDEDKEVLIPPVRFGLMLNARSTSESNVRFFLRGKIYGAVQDVMMKHGIRKFRGFIALTDFTCTSVYQDIKIAENYSLDDIKAAHGVNKKTLYTVATAEGDGAAEALKDHHQDLVKAKTPDQVKKILNPNYVPPLKSITTADDSAISPNGRMKADFFEAKGRIIMDGVSRYDFNNFQIWFANQDSWDRFMAWKKLEDEKAAEQETESEEKVDVSTELTNETTDPLTDAINKNMECWSNRDLTRDDDGNVDISVASGLEEGQEPTTYGDFLVKYIDESSVERVYRERLFRNRVPIRSEIWDGNVKQVVQKYHNVVYAGYSEDGEFVVGTKFVDGTPQTRWTKCANA
jgi:hypothetical protein